MNLSCLYFFCYKVINLVKFLINFLIVMGFSCNKSISLISYSIVNISFFLLQSVHVFGIKLDVELIQCRF